MSLTITIPTLKKFAANACDANLLPQALEDACNARGINNRARRTHFLGHLHHESGGLHRIIENLDYRAARLMQVWPKRFPTIAAAAPYSHNPPALANLVYGKRLGNTDPGDGWRYRGRGLIQLTGKANYADASKWCGIDLVAHPELAADPVSAAKIAAAFWSHKGLNPIADADDGDAIKRETKIINGGTLGLAERMAAIALAKSIWA